MTLSIVQGSWEMARNLWSLREAEIEESKDQASMDRIAFIQHETNGWLLDKRYVVLMAYEDVTPVGYAAITQGDCVGLHDKPGFIVVGWFIRPEYRCGPCSARLNLAVARVATQFGVERIQGIVRSKAVGDMLKCHDFHQVGVVYERRLERGSELRPEAGQEVHGEAGQHARGSEEGHASEPAVPTGAAACTAGGREPAHADA